MSAQHQMEAVINNAPIIQGVTVALVAGGSLWYKIVGVKVCSLLRGPSLVLHITFNSSEGQIGSILCTI